jgi:hypothetical protein
MTAGDNRNFCDDINDMYITRVNVLDMVHSEYFYFNKNIS